MGEYGNTKIGKSKEVGIIEFVGSHEKVSAVVKERFSDFHVYEIDPSGKQVHLTDLEAPKEVKKTTSDTDPELVEMLSEDLRQRVEELHKQVEERKKNTVPVEINVTKLDKQQRTKIHRWVANFPGLGSSTIDKNEEKFIVVQFASSKARNARRPETRAKYTHCVLYKEGMETSDAVMFIAKKLRLQPNLITYCGTKDKRAKTTQRICISNIEARRLIEISKMTKGVKLGNFEYQPRHLSLGELKGNHFKLLLKNLKGGSTGTNVEDAIALAVQSLKEKGFINYYGLQRFGSFDVPTHEIGKALIQGSWDKVFDLILAPKPREPEFMAEAKKLWFEDRDAVKIVKKLPTWHRSIESNLFYGLSRHYDQRDYISAFMRIPRNVRLLYVHAFQSYLWNHMATFRVKKFGLKPVAGDIVYDKTAAVDPTLFEDTTMNIDEKNLDAPEPAVPTEANYSKPQPPPVKILKEEDLETYSIFDVLIPLQGTEIKHPSPIMNDFYENLLLEHGLTADCFASYKPSQDAPRGAYRHLIQLPTEVDYEVRTYGPSDNLDDFIPSDVDRLLHAHKFDDSGKIKESPAENVAQEDKCLILEFSLPSSAYATMALREILQTSPEEVTSKKRELDDNEDDENGEVKKIRTEEAENGANAE